MKTIVLTGGGTAGHVTPNLALIPVLLKEGWNIKYIGTQNGIEKELVERENIDYYAVSSGKLRRYLSKENLTDVFKVIKGVKEATALIKKIKPDVVFSKGGFVAVPVVLGAKLNGVPVIAHESDITPGLANKIAMPFAKSVCTTFPETVRYIKGEKGINTGTPIRRELFSGEREKGLAICGFSGKKPVIMMMGGSLGAVKINNCLRGALNEILKEFDLVHICGKGNVDKNLMNLQGYRQFEYVSKELPHIFALVDIVVSRAGSNSISEFLALKKPSLLIPLSAKASRGDQILNAESFEKQGFSMVLDEDKMNEKVLIQAIYSLYKNKNTYVEKMNKSGQTDGVEAVMKLIRAYAGM
ncbi:MAG: undecaprenyldiphospho-muramoylpentapeptide beta-N-acetylglucosaminyltransferase [Lachnospiraceae bacterium]|nr:undecaprenyldiphospho-muramoylpentapeptide beta-N-acetylglucosaminyltransferase [Lachnospiraceae bacterium]